MTFLNPLENALAGVYKGAPKLPAGGKKWLVQWWPIVALIFGVLQLLAAYSLWHWGHTVNSIVDNINSLYGTSTIAHHLSVWYWASLILLIFDGVILLMAYSGLKARLKKGWDLIFLSALVNCLYGLFSAFNDYGGVGTFVMQLIVSGVVFYFLFQIRDSYKGAKAAA